MNLPINLSLGIPPGLFRTLGYGDPYMVTYFGLTTESTGPNFDHNDMYSPVAGWGAVHKFQILDTQAFAYLRLLQPDDLAESGYNRRQKMNWLIGEDTAGPPSRPYWTHPDSWDGNWTEFLFGTMVFGHQLILVETRAGVPVEYRFMTDLPRDGHQLERVFYRPIGMRRADLVYAYTHASHPWLIQKATAANDTPAPDSLTDYPRGTMYHPVWDLRDWPSNYGADLFLLREALIKD